MSVVLTTIRTLAEPAIDLLLPRHCEHCQRPAHDWLCDECALALRELADTPRCGVCAYPLPQADAPCARCGGRERRIITRYARLGTHTGVLRDLVLRTKFGGRWSLAKPLAQLLAREQFAAELLASADLIVPVPLYWLRQLRRGYNQSELLAHTLAQIHGKPVLRALRRVRHTQAQSSLRSMTARTRNVKDAFILRGQVRGRGQSSQLTGKRIVLVDDVMTSGATLREAARALHLAKPARIDAVTLTLADPKGRDFTTL